MEKKDGYTHLIWDWNGTLLNDLDLCLETINTMLVRRGLETISLEMYRQVFTFPVQDFYEKAGFDFKLEPFEVISTEFILAYEAGKENSCLMPGAGKILSDLSNLGYRQSVLSAREATRLNQGIQEYGLEGRFMTVYGLDNHHAASKLDLGLAFIADQDLDPNKILVIGDTTHDADVAAAMGVDCWLIPNGHQDVVRLEAAGVPLIPNITDIPARLAALGT